MESEASESTGLGARVARAALGVAAVAVIGLALARAGLSQGLLHRFGVAQQPKRVLRVWDWWSPSTNEAYARYFGGIEREFEAANPDVDLVFQYVPFGQYEQKMATGLVGNTPPDVFQSSVHWAEGFYDRGMLMPLNRFMEQERAERERRKSQLRPIDTGEIVDQEAFLEAAWRHNTKPDGTVFGIPQVLDSECLIWNLDILQKAAQADLEIRAMFPTGKDGQPDYSQIRFDAIKDWEHFRRVAKKLTVYDAKGALAIAPDGDPVQTGFTIYAHGAGAAPFEAWLAANGGSFQDSAGTRALFADQRGVEAMQFVLDLYWKDRVSRPFRRQMQDTEYFEKRRSVCFKGGTWSGKYIERNTEGWTHFGKTAFPPGPRGDGYATLSWGNMLVISQRSREPDLAWKYVKFITSLNGAKRLLRELDWNSPRKDFYHGPEWAAQCAKKPYLTNVPQICAVGKKLRHTQINAVNYAIQPAFETLLLHAPEIEAGKGPYPSVKVGMETAAARVDRIYSRYNAQVATWQSASKQ